MGVTYKAFDVDLHCPVTLKVIGERYLGDESARLRFLREARAAASVRHPNVASVFHLGRTGRNYFYAMEFVEGETLEKLIKRSCRLEIKLALEIAAQVAAGLAAVHIRSDLYSLGVVLWEMVTGHVVFRGSPAEVMYQHQHALLPLDLLEAVPQPVVVLIEVLLEKDPRQRFQNPTELLKAVPTIT